MYFVCPPGFLGAGNFQDLDDLDVKMLHTEKHIRHSTILFLFELCKLVRLWITVQMAGMQMILSQHVWKIQDREEAIPVAAKAQLIGLVLNRAGWVRVGKETIGFARGKIEVSHDDLPWHKKWKMWNKCIDRVSPLQWSNSTNLDSLVLGCQKLLYTSPTLRHTQGWFARSSSSVGD